MSHNWKNILIPPTLCIKDVLKVIDNEALKLAIVVDENLKLLGTVSDGDIRRALINGTPLDTNVSKIMFTRPTTVAAGTSRDDVLKLMDVMELTSIPVVDHGAVVGLETIHHVSQKIQYDNPVFLMAGGFGSRLKPLTDNCPKPLLKVGSRPILETVLLSFIRAGFYDFYISTHYLPEMIRDYFGSGEKWGVKIQYIHESAPLGTGGALSLLPKTIPDLPVIVMNGDVLTKVDFEKLLAFHTKNNANATMCVREYEYQVPFGVVEGVGNKITSLVEKPIQRFHVNAGIYVINKSIVSSLKANEYLDMPTLFENNIGKNVLMFPFYEYWLDIGRMADFNRAQIDIQTLGL